MLPIVAGVSAALATVMLLACAVLYFRLKKMARQIDELKQDVQQQSAQLGRRLDTYLTGSIQMGEQLYKLQQQLAPIPDRLLQVENRDPATISFTEAARLVGLGASSENLQQACGLSQAEAELLIRMQQKK